MPSSETQPRITGVVELPSRGKFYGDLAPEGLIELYPMTGRDEGLIANLGRDNMQEIFNVLLKRCLVTAIDPNELLSSDQFYLMLVLRANSYGTEYELTVTCPNEKCGHVTPRVFNIPDDLKVTYYDGAEVEPFNVTLPVSKAKVEFRLMRVKDEADILNYRKQSKSSSPLEDPTYVYRSVKFITSINGKDMPLIDKMRWFEDLSVRDTSALRDAMDDVASGVNSTLTTECASCKKTFEFDMPFTASFFRARRDRARKSA